MISLCLAESNREFENEERKFWIQSSDICMTVLTHGNIWEIKPTFFPPSDHTRKLLTFCIVH